MDVIFSARLFKETFLNKLLISTMLKFVLYDGAATVLHEGDLSLGTAHYSGVTWNKDTIFLSANVDNKCIIHEFDKSLNLIGTISNANLHETHQILWHNENLYATNTGLNRIEIMGSDNQWRNVCWTSATYDIDHINGLWTDNEYIYVVEFRNRSEPRPPSAIRVVDFDFNQIDEILISVGSGVHNVYIEDGIMYTLIGGEANIVRCDLSSRETTLIPLSNVSGSAWVRGLARTRDYWYIGISEWEIERDKRHVGNSIILQLDNNFNEIDRLIIPDFGPVFDVRVIDDLDLAHNGIAF